MEQDVFTDNTKPFETQRKLGVAENDFIIKHRDDDPHGFWWIGRERGQVPESLSGAYTTVEYAEQAVKVYLESK